MIAPVTKTVLLFRSLSAVCLLVWQPVEAQDWSSLQGRFVVSGDVPQPQRLEITRDEEVCGRIGLMDESLLVHAENRGLQNVVIWLASKGDIPVHPSLQAVPKPVRMDNKDCRFVPRMLQLRTEQVLQVTNSDPVVHNVAVYARRNQPFSLVIPEDKPLERSFPKSELLPIRVDCSIHAWMRAYLLITEHPYAAISDSDGRFRIEKLPPGEWEFRIWHERPGYLPKFTTQGQVRELQRGTISLQITADNQDLGELQIAASDLAAD